MATYNQYGTLSASDILTAFLASQGKRISDFGESNAYEAIAEQLMAHNAIVNEQLIPFFCEDTVDPLRLYGGTPQVEMQEMSEFGTPDAQKVGTGDNLGFPLRNYEAALQWTLVYFNTRTVADLQANVDAIKAADLRLVKREILRAIYLATNKTFLDRTSRVPLSIPVKRLLNADGFPVPPDPYGNAFDGSTHTHYLARVGGSYASTDLDAAIETVLEHNPGANIRVYINRNQESATRAFTDFQAYYDTRVIPGVGVTRADGDLDRNRLYDRAIGVYKAAEVWVKPWAINNYVVVHDATKPVLGYRHRDIDGYGQLMLVFEDEAHPLRSKGWAREFGIGANRREAAAVLYLGGTSYVEPTIT